ncbi:MAG: hypothetical protein KDB80_17140 [Planctomycetes bacterium]|nr:hypothetical protein [Planctomycetota bacterium]
MSSTFAWPDTPNRLREFAANGEPTLDVERGVFFRGDDDDRAEFHPPLVLGPRGATASVDDYLRAWTGELPSCCIVLLRAGATAIGLWHGTELIAHKAFKKYVVRGHGKAQATHLSSKGKSRYGSRLRLQNAKRQLEETNERLTDWRDAHGAADVVLYSAPVRLWPDLFAVAPPPPFERQTAVRIPAHVHTPTHEELLRVRRVCLRGRVVEPGD